MVTIQKTAEFQGLRYCSNLKARTVCALYKEKSRKKLKIYLKKFKPSQNMEKIVNAASKFT